MIVKGPLNVPRRASGASASCSIAAVNAPAASDVGTPIAAAGGGDGGARIVGLANPQGKHGGHQEPRSH